MISIPITTQLSGLTTELLLLSELDNHQHLLFDDKIQVNQLIKDIIRHEQFAADEKSLIILADLESINFLGNQRLLHQALSNLLINAINIQMLVVPLTSLCNIVTTTSFYNK